MKTLRRRVALLALALMSMAHVGSPDTFFSGQAGPYPVRVSVRLPGVIPGLAQIAVRFPSQASSLVRSVSVQAIQWNVGPEGAPPADPATPVPGDAGLYAAELWLMSATSYRVQITVDGASGIGTALVPVVALATAQKEMPRALGGILIGLMLLLTLGLLTIVGAAVRESVLPPGAEPDGRRRLRARLAMAGSAAALVLVVWGGAAWWGLEASSYAQFVLYRPFASEAAIRAEGGQQRLTLTIRDRRWPPPPGVSNIRYNALMPDHGKLMHMFLVRASGLDAFAHVHPVPSSSVGQAFDVALPPLPPGQYRVYADIVHESGYAQTLVTDATIGATPADVIDADPDDSWVVGSPSSDPAVFTTSDGTVIEWKRGNDPIVEGEDALLTFVARNADGSPAALEPYMGMLGHAAVSSVDGSVFAHLHPSGSISMAALRKFQERSGQSGDQHAEHTSESPSHVSIPYAFPKAGRYRLWIQMKHRGAVMTGAFDVDVASSS